MPAVLLVSAVLLVHVIVALTAGEIAAAGIGVGGLSFALFLLRDQHRAQAAPRRRMDGERPRPDGSTLVAILYPDEVDCLGDLLRAVEPSAPEVIVVGVTENDGARLERDPRVIDVLSGAVARTGRPVSLIGAAGPDPSALVFETALALDVSRVVTPCTEDTSLEEQRHRCLAAWQSLPPPRRALQLRLVSSGESAQFSLEPTPGARRPRS
jgi:hypothetical protein